jgi:hypothetical protein
MRGKKCGAGVLLPILAVLVMAAGFRDGPTFVSGSDSARSVSPSILSRNPEPDTIFYDDGGVTFGYFPDTGLFSAVRFTPTGPFELRSIYFQLFNSFGNTDGCTLYVFDDSSGVPGTTVLSGPHYIPGPFPHATWMQFDLPDSVFFEAGEDFHIAYGAQPGGSGGWWNATDSSTTTFRSNLRVHPDSAWINNIWGDFIIRAGGEYYDAPGDFYIHAFSGGMPPWTPWYRVEINPSGSSTYWMMYPADRGDGIWTEIDTFTLTGAELDFLYSQVIINDYFTLDTLYGPDAHDGTLCVLEITANSTDHRAETINYPLDNVDNISRAINQVTPGDYDLFYNAILEGY